VRSDQPILEVKDLKKHFPLPRKMLFEPAKVVKAVDGVSFTVEEGETFGLVGESGCGKTTTGFMLNGLIPTTSGNIFFEGKDVSEAKGSLARQRRMDMQIIFQDPFSSLNPRKKVGWTLTEPLVIHRQGSKQEQRKRVMEMLEVVGFEPEIYHRFPHELSGGQRQRIGIARALMLNPKFVICDEPVSALDVSVQSQILNLMQRLQKQFDLTYFFISHDLNVVYYMSDRVAVMYLGKIVELAPVEDVYSRPLHPYTKSLISAIPADAENPNRERIVLKGDVPNPANPPKGCAFHPRCPYVMDICRSVEPVFRDIRVEHAASCHLYK